jgi:hypothetical protein
MGFAALFSNSTNGQNSGNDNTAVGFIALATNSEGSENTAVGGRALRDNMGGSDNTAVGFEALFHNTETTDAGPGNNNTAVGSFALAGNQTASNNTAVGFDALQNNALGGGNVAIGAAALSTNQTGFSNTAVGANALTVNNPVMGIGGGIQNTAVGFDALFNNTTGFENIAVGFNAGSNITIGGDNIDIGNSGGGSGESDTIRIGLEQTATFIAGIRGATTGNNDAVAVVIDSNGQLGTISSSRRYKTEIKPMNKASESILALKPVSFRYKVHKDATPQFGLIAEEVAEVNPDLVVRDKEGKPYTVRYDAVNAMLLNEFLKEHRTVQEQGQELQKQAATIAKQEKQIEALTAGLQKVEAQLEASKPTPRVVLNNE